MHILAEPASDLLKTALRKLWDHSEPMESIPMKSLAKNLQDQSSHVITKLVNCDRVLDL